MLRKGIHDSIQKLPRCGHCVKSQIINQTVFAMGPTRESQSQQQLLEGALQRQLITT